MDLRLQPGAQRHQFGVHLLHRRKKKLGGAWLLFGERGRATDLYYGEDLRAFAADGTLSRTDLVFSRDSNPRRYVQSLVAENAPEIAAWVGRGASILVCGGFEMAAGVQAALVTILGEERLEAMTEAGLYRRDIY